MKVIIEIRPAEGGEDAYLFCHDLLEAYKKMCNKYGWKYGKLPGTSIEVNGNDSVGKLIQEAGGHRIQRISPTKRRGRVHTSTVTVAILTENNILSEFSENDIRVEWYSGSGAGGQHRNKHQNSCRIIHIPSGLVRKAETRHRETSYREALDALKKDLLDIKFSEEHKTKNNIRKSQVGSGMRGDKVRTYRFQDGIVKDHVNGTQSSVGVVMNGNFERLWKWPRG